MTSQKPTPIEVWLRKDNLQVNCTEVHEDETTRSLDVDSLSMRGAQREITGWYLAQGYKPVGRWETVVSDSEGDALETVRTFKPAPPAADQVWSMLDNADTPIVAR